MQLSDGIPVDSYGCSDIGHVRHANQDQFLIAELHKVINVTHTSIPKHYQQRFSSGARALMLLVADGVGGIAGGEEASALTLDTVVSYVTNSMRCFYKLDHQVQQELMSELARLVQESDAAVRSEALQTSHGSMATTLTMAHVLWPRAYVVQIGDSRCYHVRQQAMVQVTKDQTMAQSLLEEGLLDPDQAEESPLSDVLTQAIGIGDDEVTAEISTVELEPGDTVMLCTDGLTKHVGDQRIREVLADASSAQAACESLLQQALDDGGTDNTTVVVAAFR
jgi:serine/threonine protein phosphatase PrpC